MSPLDKKVVRRSPEKALRLRADYEANPWCTPNAGIVAMKRQAELLFASRGMIEDNKRQTALARYCVVRGFRSGRRNESF
jgi:hypothetical protein